MELKRYVVVLDKEELKKFDEIAVSQERSRSFLLRKAVKKLIGEENANPTIK